MAIKKNEIAKGVRVRFNTNWAPRCFGDECLECEDVIYIAEAHVYNDQKGDHVFLHGGSGTNSGYAYLDELDLEFPYGENHRYDVDYNRVKNKDIKTI